MKTRRNLALVAIITMTALLLITSGWGVMADIVPAPTIVPSGAYTGVLRSPVGPYTVTMTVIPTDPAGNTMIFIARADNGDPTFMSTEPPAGEADHLTDYVGNMVRTGPNTWEYTGIAYGSKKVEGQLLPEILYMDVPHGTVTSTADGNILTTKGNSAYYLPEQDVDGDCFPDADQDPIYCSPLDPEAAGVAMTRIPVTPPCVPTPLPPEGQ
jgi:hypothetical protein